MNKSNVLILAVVLAAGMVLSATLLSKLLIRVRQERAITVKGYAEADIVSDIGKFSCTCSARGTTMNEAYKRLQSSRQAALDYLLRIGFQGREIAAGTIETTKIQKRNEQGKETNETEYFDLSQPLCLTSTNVFRIAEVATGITDLIQNGVDVKAAAPEYYVSDLKDKKLRLLAAATEDGYARALTLAQGSKGKVGALTSAQQGVFQITQRHSTDTSGCGEYDTSTIEKTAKAVVTLEYAIESGTR